MDTHIKKIDSTFFGKGEVRGVKFKKIAETEKGYIFSRSDNYFEVFRKKVNIRFACESYPKSSSFGVWAWCCRSLDRAIGILHSF